MCFGCIRADVHRTFRVLHVVVRVGHRTVSPRIRHTGDCSGVTYSCLVVCIVATPETHPLAKQETLLVAVLARPHHKDGVRSAGLAQVQHLGADFVQRGIPADANVFAVHQLHGVFKSEFTAGVVTHRSTLGTMGTHIDRRVKHRFLANPDTVFNHSINRATHRAMRAYRALDLNFPFADSIRSGTRCMGFANQRKLGYRNARSQPQARLAQKAPPVHGWYGTGQTPGQAVDHRAGGRRHPAASRSSGQQHVGSLCGVFGNDCNDRGLLADLDTRRTVVILNMFGDVVATALIALGIGGHH